MTGCQGWIARKENKLFIKLSKISKFFYSSSNSINTRKILSKINLFPSKLPS
jgi:hypothetical protein